MWFAVACLNVAVTTWSAINNMEDQYNSVGPQRPSTPDRYSKLADQENFDFRRPANQGRFPRGFASIFPRPRKTAACQRTSGAAAAEWIDENVGERASRKIAIPAHYNRNERLCWPGTHDWLPRNTRRPGETCCRRSIGRPFRRGPSNAAGQQRGCTDHRPSGLRQRGRGSLAPWRVRPKEARHTGREVSGISDE